MVTSKISSVAFFFQASSSKYSNNFRQCWIILKSLSVLVLCSLAKDSASFSIALVIAGLQDGFAYPSQISIAWVDKSTWEFLLKVLLVIFQCNKHRAVSEGFGSLVYAVRFRDLLCFKVDCCFKYRFGFLVGFCDVVFQECSECSWRDKV